MRARVLVLVAIIVPVAAICIWLWIGLIDARVEHVLQQHGLLEEQQ